MNDSIAVRVPGCPFFPGLPELIILIFLPFALMIPAVTVGFNLNGKRGEQDYLMNDYYFGRT